jgi:DNA invertase Pin-like site-specific DNA recombinase
VAAQRRAALYHRVSTLDQNPTLARSELRAAAKRLGYRIVLDVEETGSGARNDRPGFQRVLRAARGGVFDALLVFADSGHADRPFRPMPITRSGQGDHPG